MPHRNAPKIAAAYDKATLTLAEKDEKRKHLGASVIGHKCNRQIWYKFRWAKTELVHEPHMLRLFRRGHREEPEFIRILEAIPGVQVWAAGESGESKEMFRISDCDGHFGGTPDGVILGWPDYPTEPALLEFKTFNAKNFAKLLEDGVMTAKWEYFVQMQIYMEKMQLGRALFAAVNKDTDDIYFETVSANGPEAQKHIERARVIIYSDSPPARISESPGWWQCKFCDFLKVCHFDDIPEISCRTCAYASPGVEGTWDCARGNPAIRDQAGCGEHVFDPRYFGTKVKYIDSNFEDNWIRVHDGVAEEIWGPDHLSSAKLFKQGFIPF